MIDFSAVRLGRLSFWASRLRVDVQQPGLSLAAAAFVLLIYSNAIELLPHLPTIGLPIARVIIYSLLAVAIFAAATSAIRIFPGSVPARALSIYAAAFFGLLIWQTTDSSAALGPATKSFISAIVQIVGFSFILGLPSVRRTVNASVLVTVTFSVLVCSVDLVIGLFSPTIGRGAGFYFNPNVAALALLLGGLGLVPVLRPSARLPIVALLAIGLAATLSRSAMLIGIAIIIASAGPIIADFKKHGGAYRTGVWVGLGVLVLGLAYLTFAYVAPTGFASKIAWAQQHVVGSPIADAESNFAAGRRQAGASVADPSIDCTSWKSIFQGLRRAQSCAWLDPAFINGQQEVNSGSARIIFGLRGAAAFFDAPWFGSGLDRAFSLAPHNSYLLFAIAYGVVGVLFVPAFCVFILLRMDVRNAIPLTLFVLTASLFSHDIFLSRDLAAGLAIALSATDRAWPA